MTIINAEIYTMAGNIIENGFVSFKNGIITEIGDMKRFVYPRGVVTPGEVIDAGGAMLFPGFIDSHTHLGMCEDGLGFEGDDLNEMTEPATPELRAIDAVNPFDKCFDEALRAGVTTVVTGPGSSNPIAGQPLVMKTCGSGIDEMVIKSPSAMKMSLGENPKSVYREEKKAPVTRMATASVIRDFLFRAAEYDRKKESGEDVDFDFALESLRDAVNRKIPVHFHAHRADDIATAVRIGREFSLDFIILHGTCAHLMTDALRRGNVPVMSGPFLSERSKPELRELTPASPGILNKAGIKISIVTDHPVIPVQYLPLCAGLAAREGMDHYEALKAITINAAELAGVSDRVGSIAVGKDADFALFKDDPLTLAAKPRMVFVNGNLISMQN